MLRRTTVLATIAGLALTVAGCVAPRPGIGAPPPSSAPPPWAVAMLDQVNAQRAGAGAPPLVWCGALGRAAQAHSEDQASHGVMSHTGSDGSTLADRAYRAGYLGWTALGENVAMGYATVDAAMSAWMGSPPHRANILDARFAHFGAGLARSAPAQPYWTQDLGRSGSC